MKPAALLLLFLAVLPAPYVRAQEIRTNAAGEKIIVYRDGTARYFNDLSLIEAQQRDSAGAAYPIVAVKIEPLAGGVDPNEEDLKRIAVRKLQIAREAEELARERAAAAVTNRLKLEKEIAAARAALNDERAAGLQRRLRLARQVEANTLAERTNAEQRTAALNRVVQDRTYVSAYNEARRKEKEGPRAPDASRTERQLAMLLPAAPAFSGYGPPSPKLTRPEAPLCGQVPVSGITPGEVLSYPVPLFSHTDETLRPYLDGKEYLSCQSWVTRDERNDRYLVLRLTFANPNAITSYGFLPANSSLSLHLLNGRVLSLQAAREAVGIIDHRAREVNYEVAYRLPRAAASELESSPLDFVRIFWSSGFEQYEVYQVTALNRIMGCL